MYKSIIKAPPLIYKAKLCFEFYQSRCPYQTFFKLFLSGEQKVKIK